MPSPLSPERPATKMWRSMPVSIWSTSFVDQVEKLGAHLGIELVSTLCRASRILGKDLVRARRKPCATLASCKDAAQILCSVPRASTLAMCRFCANLAQDLRSASSWWLQTSFETALAIGTASGVKKCGEAEVTAQSPAEASKGEHQGPP